MPTVACVQVASATGSSNVDFQASRAAACGEGWLIITAVTWMMIKRASRRKKRPTVARKIAIVAVRTCAWRAWPHFSRTAANGMHYYLQSAQTVFFLKKTKR